jgi:hypothetical protein
MHLASQSSTQLHTLFGGGYIVEQRGDETERRLSPAEPRTFNVADGAGDPIDARSPSSVALIHFRLRRDNPHFFGLLDQAIDDITLLSK